MRLTERHLSVVVPWVTQGKAARILGDALILRVDPEAISGYVGSRRPVARRVAELFRLRKNGVVGPTSRKVLAAVHPLILPPSFFPSVVPVEEHVTYRRMREFVHAGDNWRDTEWYRTWRTELERYGAVNRKRRRIQSVNELDHFFSSEILEMIRSLEATGYREGLANDIGSGMIDSCGRIMQSSRGRHRFAAARELGVRRVPIEIVGIHRVWLDAVRGGFRSQRRRELLRRHLRLVEFEHRHKTPL